MPIFRERDRVVSAEVYAPGMEEGWEHEDQLPAYLDLTDNLFAASKVDGVRLYPYVNATYGKMFIAVGDWIVTPEVGCRWTCKPDIFDRRFTPLA